MGHLAVEVATPAVLAVAGRGAAAPGPVARPEIVASWRRCADRGIASAELRVPWEAVDADSALVHAARPVLTSLLASLADEPVSIMLSDADGVVSLRYCGDRAILEALDRVQLAPGSNYSEDAVGTNGFGLALVDDRPALVAGRDHYSVDLSRFTCAGSPVHDPATGQAVGALSLTTWSERHHDLLVALAAQTAMNIEAQLTRSQAGSRGDLDGYLQGIPERRGPRLTPLEELERDAMVAALSRCRSVATAAADLGISRATLYRRIRHYRIALPG